MILFQIGCILLYITPSQDSDEDIEEYVANTVRDIRTERETRERLIITEKTQEYRVSKYRIRRRLKDIRPRTSRKSTNYKLTEI